MKHQVYIILTIVFTCLLALFTMPQNTLSKESAKKSNSTLGKSIKTSPTPNTLKAPKKAASPQLLDIRQILFKKGTIHVVIGSRSKINSTDYRSIKLQIKTKEHKKPGNWTLLNVDPKKQLTRNKNIVLFDTKMKLKKRSVVKVTLTKGLWKVNKSASIGPIAIAKAASMKNKKVVISKPMATAKKIGSVKKSGVRKNADSKATRTAGVSSGRDIPTKGFNDLGGIRSTIPTENHIANMGEELQVSYRFLDNAEAGLTTFELGRNRSNAVLASHEMGYNPDADGDTMTTHFPIPADGLPEAADYYIVIRHSDGKIGTTNFFTIEHAGEGSITIRNPREGEEMLTGNRMDLQYFSPHWVEAGPITFHLYRLHHGGMHSSSIDSLTRSHRQLGSAGAPPITLTLGWSLSNDLENGRYFITATHAQAYGESAVFSIQHPNYGDSGGGIITHGDLDGSRKVQVTLESPSRFIHAGDTFLLHLRITDSDVVFPLFTDPSAYGPWLTIYPNNVRDDAGGDFFRYTSIRSRSEDGQSMTLECTIPENLASGFNYFSEGSNYQIIFVHPTVPEIHGSSPRFTFLPPGAETASLNILTNPSGSEHHFMNRLMDIRWEAHQVPGSPLPTRWRIELHKESTPGTFGMAYAFITTNVRSIDTIFRNGLRWQSFSQDFMLDPNIRPGAYKIKVVGINSNLEGISEFAMLFKDQSVGWDLSITDLYIDQGTSQLATVVSNPGGVSGRVEFYVKKTQEYNVYNILSEHIAEKHLTGVDGQVVELGHHDNFGISLTSDNKVTVQIDKSNRIDETNERNNGFSPRLPLYNGRLAVIRYQGPDPGSPSPSTNITYAETSSQEALFLILVENFGRLPVSGTITIAQQGRWATGGRALSLVEDQFREITNQSITLPAGAGRNVGFSHERVLPYESQIICQFGGDFANFVPTNPRIFSLSIP